MKDDAISRQAVLDLPRIKTHNEWGIIIKESVDIKNVRQLPSVSTEKTGRWIDEGFYAEGHSERAYRCSECDEHYIGYVGEFKHCPNCGARMGVKE